MGPSQAENNTSTTRWSTTDFCVRMHRKCLMAKFRGERLIVLDQLEEYTTTNTRCADMVRAAQTIERVIPAATFWIHVGCLQGPCRKLHSGSARPHSMAPPS